MAATGQSHQTQYRTDRQKINRELRPGWLGRVSNEGVEQAADQTVVGQQPRRVPYCAEHDLAVTSLLEEGDGLGGEASGEQRDQRRRDRKKMTNRNGQQAKIYDR